MKKYFMMSALLVDFEEHSRMLQSARALLDVVRESYAPNNPEHKSRNITHLNLIRLEMLALQMKKASFSPAQLEEFELLNHAYECIASYRFTGLINFLRCGLDLFIEVLETGGRLAWIQGFSTKIPED